MTHDVEETLDPDDWKAMRALGHRMLDDALDYIGTLRDRPVWQHAPPEVKAHFDGMPPHGPEHPDEIYQEYRDYILPYQLGNSHPRFWGWIAGSGTVMGMYAEMLASSMDAVSGAFSFMSNNYVAEVAGHVSSLFDPPCPVMHTMAGNRWLEPALS